MEYRSWKPLGVLAAALLAGCGDGALLSPDRPTPVLDRVEHPPAWTLVDLGVPGNSFTTAYAINDAGVIGGATASLNPALVDPLGNVIVLPTLPGYPIGQVIDLNTSRVAVGLSQPAGVPFVTATVWSPGAPAIAVPGLDPAAFSVAYAINDAGVVVGYGTLTGGSDQHGYAWPIGGAIRDLGSGFAVSINRGGTIVGGTVDAGGAQQAVVWPAHDDRVVLRAPEGKVGSMVAADVNDDGVVAVQVERLDLNGWRGYRWFRGRWTLLTLPANAVATYPYSIDQSGRIYGLFVGGDQKIHGVVWLLDGRAIPLPEAGLGSFGPQGPGGVNRCGQVIGLTQTSPTGSYTVTRWDPPSGCPGRRGK